MKKFFALLITFGAFTAAFSQSRKIEEARRVINGETKEERTVSRDESSRYPESPASREEETDKIYRQYDRKIEAVRNNPLLSSEEKEKRIRDLQYERDRKIRENNDRYTSNKKHHSKNKKFKKNNGKHLGWEKGVGNPHKSGNKKDHAPGKGKSKRK